MVETREWRLEKHGLLWLEKGEGGCLDPPVRVGCGQSGGCNTLSRISRLAPQINTGLFCALCPHSCTPVLPGRSPILRSAPGQARLTSEFLPDEILEKKLQLVDMAWQETHLDIS